MKLRGAVRIGLAGVFGLLAPADVGADSLDGALSRLRRISSHAPRHRPRPVLRGAERVPYADAIRLSARRHGLPPSLLAALVRAESNFDPRAVSSAGARGLGQLMPATGRELGVTDPFDPAQNLDASARYLSRQLDRFDSPHRALAAYHAGPERVAGGWAWLPRTTHEYVSRVLDFDLEYRARGLP